MGGGVAAQKSGVTGVVTLDNRSTTVGGASRLRWGASLPRRGGRFTCTKSRVPARLPLWLLKACLPKARFHRILSTSGAPEEAIPLAREFLVVWAGRHDREPWRGLCEGYAERIRRTVPLRELVIKIKDNDPQQRLAVEADSIRAALPPSCLTVALDPRGRAMSSEAFSSWLKAKREEYPHPIAFLLGSDVGLAESLRREAQLVLAFGPMTFPHELARLMLYEQLYRALAIEHGIKYHRGRI